MQYGLLSKKIHLNEMDITYSVDMVRYKFKINQYATMDEFQRYYDNFPTADLYKSRRYYSYENVFVFRSGANSKSVITVGLGYVSDNRDDSRRAFIEYNPNKVDGVVLTDIINILYPSCSRHWLELSRWDLAIDIPVRRSLAHLYKDRRDYAYFSSATKGKTAYLGQRNEAGHVKLYDKTKESGLDENLTRLEITFDGCELPTFPRVHVDRYGQDAMFLELTNVTQVLVMLLNHLDDDTEFDEYYSMLNYKVRRKLDNYVHKGIQLDYDFKSIYEFMTELKKWENRSFFGGKDTNDDEIKLPWA